MLNPFKLLSRKKDDPFHAFNKTHLNGKSLEAQMSALSGTLSSTFSGEKFPGGFGNSVDYSCIDYYELRRKSSQLITENPYALGALRRILSNEINTGLNLESNILGSYLGISEDESQDLSEEIEADWKMFSDNPILCDAKQEKTLHQMMYSARSEALIEGDCLVNMSINKATKLPSIQIIPGRNIKTPFGKTSSAVIKHGVELDKNGKQIAYHVEQKDGTFKRLPAYGSASGRRLSWLIYASDRRVGEVRGLPFLSNMFYMLKELDRYRDSEQRAAFINSVVAGYMKKTKPGPNTNTMTNASSRKGTRSATNQDGTTQTTNRGSVLPGQFFENLPEGMEPTAHNTTRPNVNFGTFESSILRVFFWTLGIPPEIGMLEFKNNFSASRQADNEFKVYLKQSVKLRGAEYYQPIYETYMYQSALMGRYNALSLVQAWGNLAQWQIYGAWVNAEWSGISRPSVDIKKDVDAMIAALNNPTPLVTADFATRRIMDMSYNDVLNQRVKEVKATEKAGLPVTDQPDNIQDEEEDLEVDENGDEIITTAQLQLV